MINFIKAVEVYYSERESAYLTSNQEVLINKDKIEVVYSTSSMVRGCRVFSVVTASRNFTVVSRDVEDTYNEHYKKQSASPTMEESTCLSITEVQMASLYCKLDSKIEELVDAVNEWSNNNQNTAIFEIIISKAYYAYLVKTYTNIGTITIVVTLSGTARLIVSSNDGIEVR